MPGPTIGASVVIMLKKFYAFMCLYKTYVVRGAWDTMYNLQYTYNFDLWHCLLLLFLFEAKEAWTQEYLKTARQVLQGELMHCLGLG